MAEAKLDLSCNEGTLIPLRELPWVVPVIVTGLFWRRWSEHSTLVPKRFLRPVGGTVL